MDDTTAVVTGASRGIGEQVAMALADAGAHVVLCSRSAEAVGDVGDAIEDRGGSATALRADVRDELDVERVMEAAAAEGGQIDLVVANAGVYHGEPGETPLGEETYAAFDDSLRTNGRGTFATIREAIPHLADDARVLVLSGSVAREHRPGYGAYAVSKATAEAVARGFAADLDQVVGVVDPGQVATDLTGGRGRSPEDAAEMVRWAAADADASAVDGAVIDAGDWRTATR